MLFKNCNLVSCMHLVYSSSEFVELSSKIEEELGKYVN